MFTFTIYILHKVILKSWYSYSTHFFQTMLFHKQEDKFNKIIILTDARQKSCYTYCMYGSV